MKISSASNTVETLSVAKVCTSEPPTEIQQCGKEASFTHDSSPSLICTSALTDKSESESKETVGAVAAVCLEDFANPTSLVTGDEPHVVGNEITKTPSDYPEQLHPIALQTGGDSTSGHALWPTAVAHIPSEGLGDELPATHDAESVAEKAEEFPFEGVDATDDVLEASAIARTQDEGTKGER